MKESLSYPYSRVGFVHQYRPLSAREMADVLPVKWQQLSIPYDRADQRQQEVVALILRITGGNFRLLQRLFMQIERIMAINQLDMITKAVVETARESLIIGVT